MNLELNYNVPIKELAQESGNDFFIEGIAINATTTENNHTFLAEELEEAAGTLNGVPLLVDHRNEVSAIKGRVMEAKFNNINENIPFKARVVDKEVKQLIKDGLLNSVSVGASVKDIEEKDGTLIPRGISFKELSLVAVPADSNATFGYALGEAYKRQLEKTPITVNTDNSIELNGGKKMTEENVSNVTSESFESFKTEVSENMESLKNLVSELIAKSEVKEADEDEKVEAVEEPKEEAKEEEAKEEPVAEEAPEKAKEETKEEADEEEEDEVEAGNYNITQGYGTLKGGSFTLIR